jgi:hypothetical protein
MNQDDLIYMKKLVKCVRKDIEAYLEAPAHYQPEYFQGVREAISEVERILLKGDAPCQK